MRRFYVVPRNVIYETVPGQDLKYHDLFISAGGAHYVDLDGIHVLLCCDEFDRADHEALWHAHLEVARLHDSKSKEPLSRLLDGDNDHKQFAMKHATALEQIGVKQHHTVKDVSDIASKLHPLVSLREEY